MDDDNTAAIDIRDRQLVSPTKRRNSGVCIGMQFYTLILNWSYLIVLRSDDKNILIISNI